MNFFFDGVPARDTLEKAINIAGTDLSPGSEEFRPEPIVSDSSLILHFPYQENGCSYCHDATSKSELIAEQPGLCYSCHNDYSVDFKYVHGPVASGYCTFCHNPHSSKEKKLLTREARELCLYCHKPLSLLNSEVHNDIAGSQCTSCHNPHGGENRFILN